MPGVQQLATLGTVGVLKLCCTTRRDRIKDADLIKGVADDEGEDDRSLTTSDTKTRSLNQAQSVQIESRLIQIVRGKHIGEIFCARLWSITS